MHKVVMLQAVKEQVTVSNSGGAVAAVSWESRHPAVVIQPAEASIAPGGEMDFQLHITGSDVGQLQARLLCSVMHGSCQAVELTANVTGKPQCNVQSATSKSTASFAPPTCSCMLMSPASALMLST